jgi:hypothetical protein
MKRSVNYILQGLVLLIILYATYVIYSKNTNIGHAFFSYTLLLYIALISMNLAYKGFQKKIKEPLAEIAFLVLYFLVLFVPTIQLYMDIPYFLRSEYSMEEGIVTNAENYRGYYGVTLSEKEYQFWGWEDFNHTDFEDFEGDVRVRIFYLPHSCLGVNYEMIE